MRWLCVWTLCVAVALAGVGSARAQDSSSSWARTPLSPDVGWALDLASVGVGESVLLHRTGAGTFATTYRNGTRVGATQQLDDGDTFYPTVDGSAVGGAVAAWYRENAGEIRVAERGPTDEVFTRSVAVRGGRSDFSYGQPLVRVNERGDAIVVYLAEVAGGQEIRGLYRPAGGRFGEPETLADVAPWSTSFPRDVALGPDGTAALAFVRSRRAHVVVRAPTGSLGPVQSLGEQLPEHSWQSPRVGMDAAGNLVAAWLEGTSPNTAGPVRVAFRPAGRTTFREPMNSGMRAGDGARIGLGVSLIGEVILLVEAASSNPDGGTHLEGLQALTGNAGLGRIGPPRSLSGRWGSYPSFAMNGRGDALLVYGECCPMAVRARRRAPLQPFGAVEDVQPPVELDGPRDGITVRTADVDEFGNARTTYEDGELDEAYMGESRPSITAEPPEVPPLGDLIPPLLPPEPPRARPEAAAAQIPPPSPPGPPALAMSAQPIRLDLQVDRTLKGRRRVRLSSRVRCSAACTVRVGGTLGGRPLRLVQGVLPRGGALRLGLPLHRRAARRLGRSAASRRVARVRAVAVDRSGRAVRRSVRRVVRPRR